MIRRRVGTFGAVVITMLVVFASLPAVAVPPTVVSISGSLSGETGVVELAGNVRGTPEHLSGNIGSAHVTFGSPATFSLEGSLSGNVATLSGTVTHAAVKFLIGTPVTLVADAATGEIDLALGPLGSGPFAGQTLTFSGTGSIQIVRQG
jgi:hypothetical protein